MDLLFADLTRRIEPAPLLGYLNFSDGRPDAKFRKSLADVFAALTTAGDPTPWATAGKWLASRAAELEGSGPAAFRDLSQAKQVIPLAFADTPAAYREHHSDLLAHQPDAFLLTSLFLARCCESVLAERAGGTASEAIPEAAVALLNDYVGYRPIAVLETRPQTDYYPHEKVCPVPVFARGVGVVPSRYAEVLRPALELLAKTDAELLREASFDPERMDELAVDPRAVDHVHPVSKRPSMLFGEWDPHRIDPRGFFRRYVLRQPTLDALLLWATPEDADAPAKAERLFESAAVLAGTILMGAGMSGAGPTTYDSTVTLDELVKRIARYRDAFYQQLLKSVSGPHGDRLREEAQKRKQPFAGVRQFLNAAIASEKALHLQERRLAILFAAMGYPRAARDRAVRIPGPSARFGCEIRVRQTEAGFAVKGGRPAEAARILAEAEDLLRRGIDCGALIDPWNILGFQGLFPTFPSGRDSVRDPRAEDLILTIGRQFDAYAQALAGASAAADSATETRLRKQMRTLAEWWDRYATTTVADLPRVLGSERAEAADHVAQALALWKTGGATDPGFWRKHRDGFKTPAAYAQVIEALLDRPDYRAALALLVTWLSDSETVPLQDPSAAFVRLAFRWLRSVVTGTGVADTDRAVLIRRFFELLEANAEEKWHVPDLGLPTRRAKSGREDSEDDSEEESDGDEFASAYEGVTFKDSADDGTEGPIADGDGPAPHPGEFGLDDPEEVAEDRLRFLAAIARLWRTAARSDLWPRSDSAAVATIGEWLRAARSNLTALRTLAERIHKVTVPEPSTGLESVMEYDRRRAVKGQLLDLTVQTAVETAAAARTLASVLSKIPELPASVPPESRPPSRQGPTADLPGWEAVAVRLERAVGAGDSEGARRVLPGFIALFRHEPLLVCPPADGGPPAPAIRAQTALQMVESLLARLPRLGLLRETFHLTKLARSMERNDPPDGRRVSSFDQLFRTAVVGVVDALLTSAREWGDDAGEDGPLASAVRQIAESFHALWLEHSQSLRLSALEAVLDRGDWEETKDFIRAYGGDLFTLRFLTLPNIRGILGQGAAAWLDREAERDDADVRPKLVEDWAASRIDRTRATRQFELVLHALVEHHDEYRDYNTTTTQSDYGENLYILLDFLRLKVAYDRYAWRLRPLGLTHEMLCARGFDRLAAKWREFIAGKTGKLADDLLTELAVREGEHGIRLRTVRDRLEERFLQPLRIDQAGARVARAAAAAKEGQPEDNPSFSGLLTAIAPLADHPSGVGLDVPAWLRRLEEELRKARSADPETDADPTEQYPHPPGNVIPFDEVKRQLRDWDKPIVE